MATKAPTTNVTNTGKADPKKPGNVIVIDNATGTKLSRPASDPTGTKAIASSSSGSSSSNSADSAPKESPYKTGNSELDGLAATIYQQLVSGTINQDFLKDFVEVTPQKVQEFLDQATKELDPYYKQIYDRAKTDLGTSLTELTTAAKRNSENTTTGFDRNLRTTQDNLRSQGLTFSGQRLRQEGQLATDATRTLEDQQRSYSSSVNSLLRPAETKYGSSAFTDFKLPELSQNSINFTPGYTTPGQGTTGTVKAPVFNFSPGVTGTLEEERKKAEALRQSELTGAYRVQEARKRLGL